MAEYDGLTELKTAAGRRLRDAEELLQPPTIMPQEQGADVRHLRGAVYLAGYALECVLKAHLINQVGARNLTQAVAILRAQGIEVPNILGAEGHNLLLLLSLTDLEPRLSGKQRKDWGICAKWKSSWRYDPTIYPRAEATLFLGAVRRLYGWVRAQS